MKPSKILPQQKITYSKDLKDELCEYLRGERDTLSPVSQHELDSGMFLHCLLVALIELKYINAEVKFEDDLKMEKKMQNLRLLSTMQRYFRAFEEDEDEAYVRIVRNAIKKSAENPAKALDPEMLLSVETRFEQLVDMVDRGANQPETQRKEPESTNKGDGIPSWAQLKPQPPNRSN